MNKYFVIYEKVYLKPRWGLQGTNPLRPWVHNILYMNCPRCESGMSITCKDLPRRNCRDCVELLSRAGGQRTGSSLLLDGVGSLKWIHTGLLNIVTVRLHDLTTLCR